MPTFSPREVTFWVLGRSPSGAKVSRQQLNKAMGKGRDLTSRGQFTDAVELIVDCEPGLKAELRDLVLENMDRLDQSDAERSAEERLRARCESHAGLDINANDMLTPLARGLLLHAFSIVDWQSLAGKLAEWQIEAEHAEGSS